MVGRLLSAETFDTLGSAEASGEMAAWLQVGRQVR
jgi:hypothetical protein